MSGFIVYIVVSIFTPGPNNIFASISSSRIGVKKTMPFMLGILLGTTLVFLIAAYINLLLLENVTELFQYVGIVGGIFIIYLSVMMIRNMNKEGKDLIQGDKLFITAILLNFINPKTIIFGITVATYYLEIGLHSGYLYYFSILMGVICYLSVILWGLLGGLFSDILQKYNVLFNAVMASLLAYSGIIIILEAVR